MSNLIKNPKFKTFLQWALLVILIGVLAASLYVFVGNMESLRLHGYIRGHFRHQTLAQKITPDQIRGWMTFRYVNLVFNLPPPYLQGVLNIKDSHYPNISLDALAKQQKLSSAQMLAKTAAAVKNFISKPQP
jgi:hypothetical protein